MDAEQVFQSLLAIGRTGRFAEVSSLSGAGVHEQVLHFADDLRGSRIESLRQLSAEDRVGFIKAVAVYENSVGGIGSVTALQRLLPLVEDEDHALLDWVLSKTRSYWWYAKGATSFAELAEIRRAHADRRVANETRELERELAARALRAKRATEKLFNAVRRGDINAVKALLRYGASPETSAPDGSSLWQYAVDHGHPEIAAILKDKGDGMVSY